MLKTVDKVSTPKPFLQLKILSENGPMQSNNTIENYNPFLGRINFSSASTIRFSVGGTFLKSFFHFCLGLLHYKNHSFENNKRIKCSEKCKSAAKADSNIGLCVLESTALHLSHSRIAHSRIRIKRIRESCRAQNVRPYRIYTGRQPAAREAQEDREGLFRMINDD